MSDTRQQTKKTAVIGDLTGFGRCALTVSIPALASMGIQSCPVPTAIFSAHPWHQGYFALDLAPWLPDYLDHWSAMGLEFDAILVGFLRSYEQYGTILKFIKNQISIKADKARPSSVVVLDPVMGDYGKLYKVVSTDMVRGMRELMAKASVVTPNLTEACFLADRPYTDGINDSGLDELLQSLRQMTAADIVITGVNLNGRRHNILFTDKRVIWPYAHVPEDYPGCGDLFAAFLTGRLLQNGGDITGAFIFAGEKTQAAVENTWSKQTPPGYGLDFEETL